MHRANVSEIHLCQRCQRLLAYQTRGWKNAWRTGLPGNGDLPGKLFHERIAAPFYSAMSDAADPLPRQQLKALVSRFGKSLELELLSLVEKHFFLPVMAQQGRYLSSHQITQLARGVSLWNAHQARFLSQIPKELRQNPDALLGKVFHDPEVLISGTHPLRDGEILQVTGKYDALLFDVVRHEAVIMEFKGRCMGHADEDFLQVALYGWLIRNATGILPRGVVIYLESEPAEILYSAEKIECAFEKLPEIFQQLADVKCAARTKQAQALPHTSDPERCKQCSFDPRCDRDWGQRRKRATLYAVPKDMATDDFSPKPLTATAMREKGRQNRPESPLAFPLGMSRAGAVVWANLSNPAMGSILVSGGSEKEKNRFLNALVVGLALNATPELTDILLIDPGRSTFRSLACLPHISTPILMDKDLITEELHEMVDHMEERYRVFRKKRITDISAYHHSAHPFVHQVIVMDEYHRLSDQKSRAELTQSVCKLVKKGGPAGIHLILADIRPMPQGISDIFPLRVRLGFSGGKGQQKMVIHGEVPVQKLRMARVTKVDIETVLQKDVCMMKTRNVG